MYYVFAYLGPQYFIASKLPHCTSKIEICSTNMENVLVRYIIVSCKYLGTYRKKSIDFLDIESRSKTLHIGLFIYEKNAL